MTKIIFMYFANAFSLAKRLLVLFSLSLSLSLSASLFDSLYPLLITAAIKVTPFERLETLPLFM
jgi:hypothetical protein